MPLLKGRFRPATSTARFRTSSESEKSKNDPIKCTVITSGPKSLSASQDLAFKAPISKPIVVGVPPPSQQPTLYSSSPRKIPTTPFSPIFSPNTDAYIPKKPEMLSEDSDIITDPNAIQDKDDDIDSQSIVSEASEFSSASGGGSDGESAQKSKRVKSIKDIDKTTMTLSDIIRMRVSRNAHADDNPLTKIWSDIREREERENQRMEDKEISEKERIARLIKEAEERGETLTEDDIEDSKDDVSSIQVKLDEEGNIIVNEKSLYVKRESNTVIEETVEEDENEVGYGRYEDHKTNLYSFSRRKKTAIKRWNTCETEKFYMALRKVGTDFGLMAKIMPGFSRDQLKKKFKREEKVRLAKIDMALRYAFRINDKFVEDTVETHTKKRKSQILVAAVKG